MAQDKQTEFSFQHCILLLALELGNRSPKMSAILLRKSVLQEKKHRAKQDFRTKLKTDGVGGILQG